MAEPQEALAPGTEAEQPSTDQKVAGAETAQVLTVGKFQELKKELLGEVGRMLQSQTDKTEGRLRKQLEAKLQKLEAQAKEMGVSAEAITQARTRIESEELLSSVADQGQPAQAGLTEPVSRPSPAEIEETNRQIADLSDKYGVSLFARDEEFKSVDWQSPEPKKVLEQVEEALKKKAERLDKPLPPPPASPQARMPSVGGAASGSTLEKLTQRLNEIQTLDPFKRNPELNKEREQVIREMGGY